MDRLEIAVQLLSGWLAAGDIDCPFPSVASNQAELADKALAFADILISLHTHQMDERVKV